MLRDPAVAGCTEPLESRLGQATGDGDARHPAYCRFIHASDLLPTLGRNPFSFFIRYEAPWRYVDGGGGVAAYLESDGVAVVWADPLVAADASPAFLDQLTSTLRGNGLRICLLLIGSEVAAHALERGYAVLKIGEQPFFALDTWRKPRGNAGKHLRWCLNKAARAGVHVRPYEPADAPAVAATIAAWQSGLGRAAADSFLRASPLTLADEKRLFLASANGRVEAVLACSPVPAANGWLLEDLARRHDAPTGATEALVVHGLESLAADGAACAWMDVAPLRGMHDQIDARARLVFLAAAPAVAVFDTRYHLRNLATYLGKFAPTSWVPRYVALKPWLPTPSLVRALRKVL